jgi:hypothetical protein
MRRLQVEFFPISQIQEPDATNAKTLKNQDMVCLSPMFHFRTPHKKRRGRWWNIPFPYSSQQQKKSSISILLGQISATYLTYSLQPVATAGGESLEKPVIQVFPRGGILWSPVWQLMHRAFTWDSPYILPRTSLLSWIHRFLRWLSTKWSVRRWDSNAL